MSSSLESLKPPRAPGAAARASMQSVESDSSFHKAEIGEAVPINVSLAAPSLIPHDQHAAVQEKRFHSGAEPEFHPPPEHHHTAESHDANAPDAPIARDPPQSAPASRHTADLDVASLTSLNPSESVPRLGRLNTITSSKSPGAPQMTVHTEVDSVVPPRLQRRPVSEHFAAAPPPLAANPHRFSLQVSDDLDRLMESASQLQHERSPRLEIAPGAEHVPLESIVSSDSYETAGDGYTALQESLGVVPLKIPKRPDPQSMERVREASRQYSVRSDASAETQNETIQDAASVGVMTPGRESLVRGRGVDSVENREAADKRAENTGSPDFTAAAHGGERQRLERQLQADIAARDALRDAMEQAPAEISPASVYSAVSSVHMPLDHGRAASVSSASTTRRLLHLLSSSAMPQQPLPTPIGRSDSAARAVVRDSVHVQMAHVDDDNDDEYYDIDDDVVAQPARAKSVKDSTSVPVRSRKKGRRRQTQHGLLLKPFSYLTLINLLESINGTVIGEEFETLNIPIKEKQLIEKIVDSLSRLTSDMVLDENRYEVGMERLEKAHRVLEGFL